MKILRIVIDFLFVICNIQSEVTFPFIFVKEYFNCNQKVCVHYIRIMDLNNAINGK